MMTPARQDYIVAHEHTFANEDEIKRSNLCGCCYCERIFPASEITEDCLMPEPGHENKTVLCPYCGIDAVFGDASGIEPTADLLHRMLLYYF